MFYRHKMIDEDLMQVVRAKLRNNPDAVYKRQDILALLRIAEVGVFADKLEILKKKMKLAFAEIRKQQKIYIRQGFSCCGSCGSHELTELCGKTGKKGYMFFSRQSKTALDLDGYVFFNFYSMDDEGIDENTNTKKLAKRIINKLRQHGINVEWNGDYSDAIKVGI